MKDASPRMTLCEYIRQVNDLLQGDSSNEILARKLLFKAMNEGKKISKMIVELDRKLIEDHWSKYPKNKRQKELLKHRQSDNYKSENFKTCDI